jgi:hypothetical protein
MANLILPVAGAVAGSFFGPLGAQIGWMIGSAVQAGREQIVQPKVGDLRIQTSQYGSTIPFVIGRQRVSGNIIWADKKKEYQAKSRAGKGGPTTVTTGYTQSMLIALCKGPIQGVSRVWADGKLIIDARNSTKPLIGQLYLGDDTQTADPTYMSVVGAQNAPAYRGLAYISLTNFDLGVTGRVPQFSFEIVSGGGI